MSGVLRDEIQSQHQYLSKYMSDRIGRNIYVELII